MLRRSFLEGSFPFRAGRNPRIPVEHVQLTALPPSGEMIVSCKSPTAPLSGEQLRHSGCHVKIVQIHILS